MERDDVQTMWAVEAARTSAAMVLNQQYLRALAVRGNLSRVRWGSWLELFFDAIAVLWLGSFAFGHLAVMRFFIPALLLFAGAIALLQVHIRSLVDARPPDYAEPVLALQKRLERIRLRDTIATRAIFGLCWLAWTPLFIVVAKANGFDVYSLGVPFLLANVAFGIVAAAVIGWLFRTYENGRIARALDGTTAKEARSALATIAAFESEMEP